MPLTPGILTGVEVCVASPSQELGLETDETYSLQVPAAASVRTRVCVGVCVCARVCVFACVRACVFCVRVCAVKMEHEEPCNHPLA